MFGLFQKPPAVEPSIPELPLAWPPTSIAEVGPRMVRFTSNTELALWVLRAISIFAIVIGVPYILQSANTTSRLARDGEVVQARVTDLRSSTGKNTTYWVSYLFDYRQTSVYDDQNVDADTYATLSVGSRVPVTVMPGDPYNHRYGLVTEDDARRQQGQGSLWVMLVSGAAGIGALAFRGYARGQKAKLESWLACPAQAIGVTSESAGKSGRTYTLRYRLLMPDGKIGEFVHTQTGHEAPPAQSGDTFTALLNPDNRSEAHPVWSLTMVEVAPEGWKAKSLPFFP